MTAHYNHAAYIRAEYRLRKRLGLCVRCGQDRTPGRVHCPEHVEWNKARDARKRAGRKTRALIISALLLAGCSFQTAAADDMLGAAGLETSCGYYELSTLVTEQRAACWEQYGGGKCFMSERGACGPHATQWPPGTKLTQWCPIGDPGTEVTVVVPCD